MTPTTEKLAECAHWLVEKLNGIGLEAQLVSDPGHPVVWAKNKHQPGRRTVMLYGHYDVQPPDPLELWDSPPFDPVLKNGYVFARGATDNKGQILAHILGIQETLEERWRSARQPAPHYRRRRRNRQRQSAGVSLEE